MVLQCPVLGSILSANIAPLTGHLLVGDKGAVAELSQCARSQTKRSESSQRPLLVFNLLMIA